jgi:Putative zinc-finger
MRGHVSAESLARYAEGLLSHGRAARIRAHLAGCPRCAAEQARLTEVTVLLREIPAAPLPPAVAARLDAALAAESALRAAQPVGAAQGGHVPQTNGAAQPAGGPGRPRRPADGGRWRWLQAPAAARGLAAAATLVVLGGVGYGIAQAVSSTSSSPSGASSSSGAAREAKPGGAAGAGPNTGSGMHQNSSAGGSSVTIPVTHSGTHYQPGTLGQQAATVLAKHPAAAQSLPPVSVGPLAQRPDRQAASRECALAIARGGQIRLVDDASYQGRPALIIVVQGQPPRVYVASPGCTAAHPGIRVQVALPAAG